MAQKQTARRMMRQLLHTKMLEIKPRVFRGRQFNSHDEPCSSDIDKPWQTDEFFAQQRSKNIAVVSHARDHLVRQQIQRGKRRCAYQGTAAECTIVGFRGFKVRTISAFP